MYCDGIKLIKFNKNEDRKSLFNDNSSDASSNVSEDEEPSQKSQEVHKGRSRQINAKVLKSVKEGDLLKTWENGGPIKLLKNQGDEAEGYLFFKNYKKFDYDKLKDLIHESGCTFLSMKEQDNDCIKVRLKTECDVKLLYNYLKQDNNYDVSVLLDTEDFYNNKIKEKRIKTLAKFKYSTRQTSLSKTHEDILSDVATANKLDANIRFQKPKGGIPRKKRNTPPKDPAVVERKLQLENILRSRSKSPIIGTWQGHIIVLPRTPPPIVCSTKPSNSYEKTNENNLENSKCVNELVDTAKISLFKNEEVLIPEKNKIKEERKIVLKQSDELTEFKSKKTNDTVLHHRKPKVDTPTDEKFPSQSSEEHSTPLKKQSPGRKDESTDNLSTRIQENRNQKCIPSSKYFQTDSSSSSDEEEIESPPREGSPVKSSKNLSYRHSRNIYLVQEPDHTQSNMSCTKYIPGECESSTSSKVELASPPREGSLGKSYESSQNLKLRNSRNNSFDQNLNHDHTNISSNEYSNARYKSSSSTGNVKHSNTLRRGVPRNSFGSSHKSNYRLSKNNGLNQKTDQIDSHMSQSKYFPVSYESRNSSSRVELASPIIGSNYSRNSSFSDSRNNSLNQQLVYDHSNLSQSEYFLPGDKSSTTSSNVEFQSPLREGGYAKSYDYSKYSNFRDSRNNSFNQQSGHHPLNLSHSENVPAGGESSTSSSNMELASPLRDGSPVRIYDSSQNSNFRDSRNNSLDMQPDHTHSNISHNESAHAREESSTSPSEVELANALRRGGPRSSYGRSRMSCSSHSRNNSLNQHSGHGYSNLSHSELIVGYESSSSSGIVELASPLRESSLLKNYNCPRNLNFRDSGNNSVNQQPDHHDSNKSRCEYLPARDESLSSTNMELASKLRRGGPRSNYGRSRMPNFSHSRNNSQSELLVGHESSSSSGTVGLRSPLKERGLLKSYDSPRNSNFKDSRNNAFNQQSGHPHSNISHSENVSAGDEPSSLSNVEFPSPLREGSFAKMYDYSPNSNFRDSRDNSPNLQPDHTHSNIPHRAVYASSRFSGSGKCSSILKRGGPRSSHGSSQISNRRHARNNPLNQQPVLALSNMSHSKYLSDGYSSSSS